MPEIPEDMKKEFVKASEVKTGDVFTVLGGGSFQEGDYGRKCELPVKDSEGHEYLTSLNKTSVRAISKVHGENTDNWKDKDIKVEVTQSKIDGKTKDILYWEPVE